MEVKEALWTPSTTVDKLYLSMYILTRANLLTSYKSLNECFVKWKSLQENHYFLKKHMETSGWILLQNILKFIFLLILIRNYSFIFTFIGLNTQINISFCNINRYVYSDRHVYFDPLFWTSLFALTETVFSSVFLCSRNVLFTF